MSVGFVPRFRRRAIRALRRSIHSQSRTCSERLERRVLLAGSPTDVVGAGTFGAADAQLHDHRASPPPPSSPGSTNVEGNVINIAANATDGERS